MNPIKARLQAAQAPELHLLQVRLSKPLYARLRARLKAEGVTLQQFVEAAAAVYLESK